MRGFLTKSNVLEWALPGCSLSWSLLMFYLWSLLYVPWLGRFLAQCSSMLWKCCVLFWWWLGVPRLAGVKDNLGPGPVVYWPPEQAAGNPSTKVIQRALSLWPRNTVNRAMLAGRKAALSSRFTWAFSLRFCLTGLAALWLSHCLLHDGRHVLQLPSSPCSLLCLAIP